MTFLYNLTNGGLNRLSLMYSAIIVSSWVREVPTSSLRFVIDQIGSLLHDRESPLLVYHEILQIIAVSKKTFLGVLKPKVVVEVCLVRGSLRCKDHQQSTLLGQLRRH